MDCSPDTCKRDDICVNAVPSLVRALRCVLGDSIADLHGSHTVSKISGAFASLPPNHPQRAVVSDCVVNAIVGNNLELVKTMVTILHPAENVFVNHHGRLRRVPFLWSAAIKNHRIDITQFLLDHNPLYMTTCDERNKNYTPIIQSIKTSWTSEQIGRLCAFAKSCRLFSTGEAFKEDKDGYTPIHHAIIGDRPTVVRHIVTHHRESLHHDLPLHNHFARMTPLTFAAARGAHSCVRVLLSLGSDPSYATTRCLNALHTAISYGLNRHVMAPSASYVVCVSVLANDCAFDVNTLSTMHTAEQHWTGMHALHLLAYCMPKRERYAVRMATTLTAVPGIDIEAKTSNGANTPLLLALRYAMLGVAAVLIKAGADTSAMNAKGKDAFDYVCISYSKLPHNELDDDSYDAMNRRRLTDFARILVLHHGHENMLHRQFHRSISFAERRPLCEATFWRKSCHDALSVKPIPRSAENNYYNNTWAVTFHFTDKTPAVIGSCTRMCCGVLAVLLCMQRLWSRKNNPATRSRRHALAGCPIELSTHILSFLPLSSFVPHMFFSNFVR